MKTPICHGFWTDLFLKYFLRVDTCLTPWSEAAERRKVQHRAKSTASGPGSEWSHMWYHRHRFPFSHPPLINSTCDTLALPDHTAQWACRAHGLSPKLAGHHQGLTSPGPRSHTNTRSTENCRWLIYKVLVQSCTKLWCQPGPQLRAVTSHSSLHFACGLCGF